MITVTGLTKRYGRRVAVDDLTFDVAAGRVTGFVGPNGAGKSTTMRMMVGLTRPDHGDVRYDDVSYDQLRHPARVVGAVLDARCMHPGRTARNHLQAAAALSGIPFQRVEEVLEQVGLASAADQRAGGFSLGMRQRLALAGALLGEPEVLLLDEPSNGLDPDGIRWLRNSLRGFADQGGTVFVSSHLIAELAMFADDLVVVGAGKLLAAEPVHATLARGGSAVTVRERRVLDRRLSSHRGELAKLSGVVGMGPDRSCDPALGARRDVRDDRFDDDHWLDGPVGRPAIIASTWLEDQLGRTGGPVVHEVAQGLLPAMDVMTDRSSTNTPDRGDSRFGRTGREPSRWSWNGSRGTASSGI